MQPTMPSNVERGQRGQCARVLADAFTDDAIWNELRPRSTRRAGSALYLFFWGEVAICARSGGYLQATFDADGEVTGALIAYERTGPRFPWWVWLFRIPAILVLGPGRTVKMARMLGNLEDTHPVGPHIYFWYVGSRVLGGGAALFKRVMKVARAKNLPCYGEAKGVGVAEMCEILGWQVLEPVELGYGHSVAPVAWTPGDRAVLR
ncbi:hypothetical protein [Nocardia salmonicida]|uniref:hypothetical protein n=1 Tax=Nocardia salmonicida TaxID=53431 RepID=UPI0037B69F8D